MESIKALLDKNYTIVCDTNVFLRLYDYSPAFTFFAVNCLNAVKDKIVITCTTNLEYEKHYRGKYQSAKNKIENYDEKFATLTQAYKSDMNKEFERINQYHFPDMDRLKSQIDNSLQIIEDTFREYGETHELLIAVNENYLETDPIFAFISGIPKMPSYSFEKLYRICDEGYKRYKTKQPPGFMDKGKDGIRLYGDLILWNEIIDYSCAEKANIIFITDDVKEDWWEYQSNGNDTIRIFHTQLKNEFEKKTHNKIVAYTSSEFFDLISSEFSVEKSDEVDLALSQTTESFIEAIQFKAFEKVEDELIYSQEKYIDELNSHIGSEGISEFEIEDYELQEYQLTELNGDSIVYELLYNISLSATSCDYIGRDDDTREIITSPEHKHTFSGILALRVTRVLNDFADLLYEDEFDDAEILSCNLEETEFVSGYDEPEESFDDWCPKCGCGITLNNDAGNGFCTECTKKYDI